MKVFLFDLDGTLVDSAQDIALSLRLTLDELGMPEKMPEEVKNLIGGGVRALLEKVLGDDFEERHVEVFRRNYMRNPVVYTKPYEGVPETLRELKRRGIRLGVVTNKMEELSVEILRRLNLLDLFEVVVGGDTFGEKKPSPVPVIKALELIGERPEDSLMVGDTEADIIAGREAGARTALAQWGYSKLSSVSPDFVLKSPKDLLSLASRVCGVS